MEKSPWKRQIFQASGYMGQFFVTKIFSHSQVENVCQILGLNRFAVNYSLGNRKKQRQYQNDPLNGTH